MRGHVITDASPREAFRAAAAAAGLSHAATFSREGTRPYQEAWANANRSVVLQYVEEPNLEVEYFFLKGDPTLQAYVMSNLVQVLEYVNREQILSAAKLAESVDDRIVSSNRLAVAETDPDAEVLEVLTQYTLDDDEVVRTAATRALGHLRWQQNRALFEKLAAEDPSEYVRHAARVGLDDLR
jgi:HEAT repeat protein